MGNPLSTDELMEHLKDKHSINISNLDKQNLKNIGYFHGYKGYRFVKENANRLKFNHFNEVVVLNNFDIELKTLFYPHVMFIETALKNYVLEEVLKENSKSDFESIYKSSMTYYKSFDIKTNPKAYKKNLHDTISVKSQFYKIIAREYSRDSDLIKHFYDKNSPVPIWALFEVISMGEFASFLGCLDIKIKEEVSKLLGLNQEFDKNKLLLEKIILCLKDLRNAIAHNNVIYDRRFTKKDINKNIGLSIKNDINIENDIDFSHIQDYFILIIYLLKKLYIPQTELINIINSFENLRENFYNGVSKAVFFKIFTSNSRKKLESLKVFVNKQE
jgi:abortive infection bacteriophage resistance protein